MVYQFVSPRFVNPEQINAEAFCKARVTGAKYIKWFEQFNATKETARQLAMILSFATKIPLTKSSENQDLGRLEKIRVV